MSITAPTKLEKAFAEGGGRNVIPVASQIGVNNGAASYTDGFPPLTRTPIAAGGIPPFGLDMNGVLYEQSRHIQWLNAGGFYAYDSAYATAIGGYPEGARLAKVGLPGTWYNLVDGNTTDPDDGGANWMDVSGVLVLPTAPDSKLSDVIKVLDRQQDLYWQTIGTFTGYASAEVGKFDWGTTDTPRPFEELAIGQTIDGTLPKYQALIAWVIATGKLKASADWVAKEYFWADLGGGMYKMPDMRNQFIRATGTDADTAIATPLGGSKMDTFKSHTHEFYFGANIYQSTSPGTGMPTASPTWVNTRATGTAETAPMHTYLNPIVAL